MNLHEVVRSHEFEITFRSTVRRKIQAVDINIALRIARNAELQNPGLTLHSVVCLDQTPEKPSEGT